MFTSTKFANPENTIVVIQPGNLHVSWPCRTWHREDIQSWLDEGNTIAPYVAPNTPAPGKTVEQRLAELEARITALEA